MLLLSLSIESEVFALKAKTKDKTITGKTIKGMVLPIIVLSLWIDCESLYAYPFHSGTPRSKVDAERKLLHLLQSAKVGVSIIERDGNIAQQVLFEACAECERFFRRGEK